MFDLFQLHQKEDKVPRNWIKIGGKDLIVEIRKLLVKVLNSGYSLLEIAKMISKNTITNLHTTERQLREIKTDKWYTRKNYIAIPLLDCLIKINKQEDYEKLKWKFIRLAESIICNTSRSRPIIAVKELSTSLCKIAGAHAADGTLHIRKTAKNSYSYFWSVLDGDENALLFLKELIIETFGLDITVKKSKGKNSFFIAISNKIIVRYLHKILGFPLGKKFDSVDIPKIIKESNKEMRSAFALGVLTFDGCVDAYGYARLDIKSKKLRDSISRSLKENDIKVMNGKQKRKDYTLKVRIIENNFRILKYFAPETLQWYRAKVFVGNHSENLIDLFQGNSNNKINLKEVMKETKKLRIFTISQLQNKLKVSKRTLRAYLKILEKVNIIKIIKSNNPIDHNLSIGNLDITTGINLKEDFRCQLFEKALSKFNQQKELARIIGVYPSYIWEWKNGRAIELGNLKKILEICNMNLSSISSYIENLNKNVYIYVNGTFTY